MSGNLRSASSVVAAAVFLLLVGGQPARLYGDAPFPGLSEACMALLGPRAAVNAVMVVPVGRSCEAACLEEITTLAEATRGLPEEAVRLSVVFSRAGAGENEEQLFRRVERLSGNVRGVVDSKGLCLQGLGTLIRKGLAPAKVVFDREGDILALDYCAELPPERRAFEAIVMKSIRKIYRIGDAPTDR